MSGCISTACYGALELKLRQFLESERIAIKDNAPTVAQARQRRKLELQLAKARDKVLQLEQRLADLDAP